MSQFCGLIIFFSVELMFYTFLLLPFLQAGVSLFFFWRPFWFFLSVAFPPRSFPLSTPENEVGAIPFFALEG